VPELNPVTRTRLWYIVIFLAFDAVVALGVSAYVPPTDTMAIYAIGAGLIMGVIAGAIGSFLIATRKEEVNLRAERQRE